MKKSYFLIITALLILNSCGDKGTGPVLTDVEEYLPLHIGNYWIYETYDSLNNEIYIDSMIVVSYMYNKEFPNSYLTYIFREGVIKDSIIFMQVNNSIKFFIAVFKNIDKDTCCKLYYNRWNDFNFWYDNWTFRDSIDGDEFPSVIRNPSNPSDVEIVRSLTAYIFEGKTKRYNELYYFNRSSYQAQLFKIDIQMIYKIVKPDNIQFARVKGLKYSDDFRSVNHNHLFNDFMFAKGIGLVGIKKSALTPLDTCFQKEESILIRYKLN